MTIIRRGSFGSPRSPERNEVENQSEREEGKEGNELRVKSKGMNWVRKL